MSTMNRGGGDGTAAVAPSQDGNLSAPSPLTSLAEFVALAKEHGSPCVTISSGYTAPDTPVERKPFKVGIRSPDTGDCGMGNCRCSPGLWLNAFEDGKVAIAHFGKPLDYNTYEPVDDTEPSNWNRGSEIDIEREHLTQFWGLIDALKARGQAPGW